MSKSDAVIKLGADGTAAVKEVQSLSQKINGTLDTIGKSFMGALGMAAGVKSIASAFSAFTQPAAELENVATSLGVVMGNAEAAVRLTGSLQRLATNGVVGMEDLHKAARTLAGTLKDPTALAHYVGVMANISAATDIPAASLARLVAGIQDLGKAELTELAKAGVPIHETLAKVLGKTRDEVLKMGAAGQITGSNLLEAFEDMTAAGGRFHDMNAQRSNTTAGSWDTLKASITECMAALGEPINDELRPMLQELATWVQENKASISAVGKGIVKVCTNVHTLTITLGILAATMRGTMTAGMMRMVAGFKPIMAGLRSFRMAAALTGSYWQATMAGMAVATRAAALAMKGALISTGIGAAVWLVGEAVAWCVEKFSDGEDAASDMGAAAQDAADATTAALEASQRLLRQQEDANRAERERTQQLQEQARLAQEAADAEKERLRTVAEMARARRDNDFEREMDALRDIPAALSGGESGVVRERLRRVGAPSEEALYAERDRLERSASMSEEQQKRYEAVAAAIGKIEEEHRKAEEAARTHRQEMERLRGNYYDRKSTYNQGRKDAAYEKKSIGGQERQLRSDAQAAGYWGEMNPAAIRGYLDALAKADAKANEDSIAALERILQLHDELVERKAKYQAQRSTDMQELRIQALELAGRKRAADALREELELQQRITELRERGATKKQATEQATMEAKMRAAAEQRERLQAARVEFIQGHQASVGGGGVSYRLGQSQLQESKKHGKLLREIRDYLRGQKASASAVAVLA